MRPYYTKCNKTLHAHSFIIIMVCRSSPGLFREIFSNFSAEITQLRDITLSARYGQLQGCLTTVRFQKYLADSTSHTRPLHSRDSTKCTDHDGFYCHSRASVDFFNFVRQMFLLFHLFLLSSKDLGPLAQLYR